ncbi:RHS repeat-associated core domain-containing protein, partial [Bacillus wiedmannii]
EIGMYYLIARYYNPEHGVFLSVDPDPGDSDDPITQNAYTYAHNNPVMKIDADGHHPLIVAGIYGYRVYKGYQSYKKFKKFSKAAKTVKTYKGSLSNKTTLYKDVTSPTSIVKNRSINIDQRQFGRNLVKNGWDKKKSKDGTVSIYLKNGSKYSLRKTSKSKGEPTADFTPRGKKKATVKIRFPKGKK